MDKKTAAAEEQPAAINHQQSIKSCDAAFDTILKAINDWRQDKRVRGAMTDKGAMAYNQIQDLKTVVQSILSEPLPELEETASK